MYQPSLIIRRHSRISFLKNFDREWRSIGEVVLSDKRPFCESSAFFDVVGNVWWAYIGEGVDGVEDSADPAGIS